MNNTIVQYKVMLATPNSASLDYKSPKNVKSLYSYVTKFNKEQPHKKIKVVSINKDHFVVLLKANESIAPLQRNGRDLVALSNIFIENDWLNYSSTDKLFTVNVIHTDEDYVKKFENSKILPDEYNYAWSEDLNGIIQNDTAIELLKSLILLTDNQSINSEEHLRERQNSLIKIKEILFETFY